MRQMLWGSGHSSAQVSSVSLDGESFQDTASVCRALGSKRSLLGGRSRDGHPSGGESQTRLRFFAALLLPWCCSCAVGPVGFYSLLMRFTTVLCREILQCLWQGRADPEQGGADCLLKHFNARSLLPEGHIYSSWSKVKYRLCLGGSASLPSPTNEVQHTITGQ